MTWLVWRRQRGALLLAAALVVVTVALLVVARLLLESRAAGLGDSACLVDPAQDCTGWGRGRELYDSFLWPHRFLQFWLWALVPLLGLIVAAALFTRETEEGTAGFVLTQSVSRARWWTTNIATTLLPALAGALVLTLVARWALAPFETLFRQGRIEPLGFELHGTWPLASVLISFSLAAALGTWLRSSLAVVVGTVLGWLVIFAVLLYTRYDILPTSVQVVPIGEFDGTADVDGMPRDMAFRGPAGEMIGSGQVGVGCGPQENYSACLQREGVTAAEFEYQPESNFWPLQLIQSGVAIILSAALLSSSYVRARRLG
ncbi:MULTISPECIES: hypothetical protein [Pseudonocardia]|uniref:ABC-2 family transporter protein n=2 Tax=Pseudonocardia TaxID=1847 RepID=A0A1Y2MM84_PSEAH|nr:MULTISPECIES: hypothetical protein [Pseudonocardia]OSY36366.1 ABC-2 family transporter protein [Pseudonocardia autotrophica]TDN72678.1 hypothetical protein C8E95_1738 [Pseudonocardia autotrophica]BBG03389.1 transporter [Pseudonocardia autotrophica]GEC27256.1 transporter [Pseudonocardia saturnea]